MKIEMKSHIKKATTNLSMNEYSANAHIVMVVVYGVLFSAWLIAELSK